MNTYKYVTEEITKWIKNQVQAAGKKGAVIGLSGGIDSGVTAALCVRALGKENVLGLVLPCYSIPEDTSDGFRIAKFLSIPVKEIDLSSTLDTFVTAGSIDKADVLNVANVKARLRMTMCYAYSSGKLVAGTGNYSETKTGYWTKWGDGAADFLPIADLWKNEVNELAKYLELPDWMVERVPSAGLWLNQSDEDEMGVSYKEIRKYFEEGEDSVSQRASIRIAQLYAFSEHKRKPIPFCSIRGWLDERN